MPAGWFLMGEDDGPRTNQPQRRVYLDAFKIDQAEWEKQLEVSMDGAIPGETHGVLKMTAFSPAAGETCCL